MSKLNLEVPSSRIRSNSLNSYHSSKELTDFLVKEQEKHLMTAVRGEQLCEENSEIKKQLEEVEKTVIQKTPFRRLDSYDSDGEYYPKVKAAANRRCIISAGSTDLNMSVDDRKPPLFRRGRGFNLKLKDETDELKEEVATLSLKIEEMRSSELQIGKLID
eukprot:Platyproteum_vivax@DN14061_c0_g1_i1.p1